MGVDLQAKARAVLSGIKTRVPTAVVAVVYDGRTANGVDDTLLHDGGADEYGERGPSSGTVRVDASELDEPPVGAEITVAGNLAIVQRVRRDPAGALLAIEYVREDPAEVQ